MTVLLLLLLLGAVRWTSSHVIFSNDPARITRIPYDDWRPIREAPMFRHVGHPGMRYPVFHKGYNFSPPKKIPQQTAEHSENVHVFSPAPPTILGSFSVFGHATVNAREHASHITKKSPRPQLTADYPQLEPRPKHDYQLRHQYVAPTFYGYTDQLKRPQRYNDFHEQAYYFDASLRPPPREINNKVSVFSPHAQSTSLTPNTFYFEQPQQFHSSNIDNSFHKARKPSKTPHHPFRLPNHNQGYSTPGTIDHFKPLPTSNDFEPSSIAYFNNNLGLSKNKNPSPDPGYFRNPFGDIHLNNGKRPEHVKPVKEDKDPAKDVYEQYSHLGRPFQNSQAYSTTVQSQKEFQTFTPFVTTFPSLPQNVKFSDVAQPFQINDYHTPGSVSSIKPDYIVTQQPFTQDVYPITVTTIDVPSNQYHESKGQKVTEAPFIGKLSSRPYSKPVNYESYSNHRPQVQISSYQGYNENVPSPFLPTPSTDTLPYLSEPTADGHSTEIPDVNEEQDVNLISTIDSKYQENAELPTENPTTTLMVETTTKYRPNKRRRPVRPSHRNEFSDNSKLKNHRLTDDVSSTTTDYYKHQRRRKPGSKYRENSEFKRFKTSSTTTPMPEVPDVTEIYGDPTTIFADDTLRISNENVILRPKDDEYNNYDPFYHSPQYPLSEVQVPENEHSVGFDEPFHHSTASPVPVTTPTTTTVNPPISVTTPTVESVLNSNGNRLKSKYGSNRPRFSVKDYRDRLNRVTSTSAPTSSKAEEELVLKNRIESTKLSGRIRTPRPNVEPIPPSTEQSDVTTESKFRKYKSRIGPSRYKTTTTQQPENQETTTERVNTFKPSTNRYKPGTGKYYSRYRTSTIPPKEVDDSPVTTTRVTIRPKGVFSAKRRPFPIKTKPLNKLSDDDVSAHGEEPGSLSSPKLSDVKMNENEVFPDILTKKMDDALTTTISNEDSVRPSSLIPIPSDHAGDEAMRIADLTSSSTNDFHSSGFFNNNKSGSRRPLPKISIPTEEPILPLEAFFQTHNQDK